MVQYESFSVSHVFFNEERLWCSNQVRIDFENSRAEIDCGYVNPELLRSANGEVEISLPTKDNKEYKVFSWRIYLKNASVRLGKLKAEYKQGCLFTYVVDFAYAEQKMTAYEDTGSSLILTK